jgi:hypothetical protein
MNNDTPVEETVELPVYKQISEECARIRSEARRVVEGTEFLGFNRAEMRARGKRSDKERSPKWAGNLKKPYHFLLKMRAEAYRQKQEEAAKTKTEPKPHHAEPMKSERRWAIYGDNPTPAQDRRLRKKFRKSAGRNAS